MNTNQIEIANEIINVISHLSQDNEASYYVEKSLSHYADFLRPLEIDAIRAEISMVDNRI